MISLVTLSPAIDVTYEVASLVPGQSHRVQKVFRTPGGKGVNISRALSLGGIKNQILLPLGGQAGDWMAAELDRLGQKTLIVKTVSETRTCLAVVDNLATVFNETAPILSRSEFSELLEDLRNMTGSSVGIISGSIPPSYSTDSVKELFNLARSVFKKLIIDTSGPWLLAAAESGADFLKPNRQELEEATSLKGTREGAMRLIELGAKSVLVSLGAEGAQLHTSESVLEVAVEPERGNPTGAGDAMVAALSWGMSQGKSPEELLTLAATAGKLAVREKVAGQFDWSSLVKLSNELKVRKQ